MAEITVRHPALINAPPAEVAKLYELLHAALNRWYADKIGDDTFYFRTGRKVKRD